MTTIFRLGIQLKLTDTAWSTFEVRILLLFCFEFIYRNKPFALCIIISFQKLILPKSLFIKINWWQSRLWCSATETKSSAYLLLTKVHLTYTSASRVCHKIYLNTVCWIHSIQTYSLYWLMKIFKKTRDLSLIALLFLVLISISFSHTFLACWADWVWLFTTIFFLSRIPIKSFTWLSLWVLTWF